mgnify:CR=1 FL=1
MSAFTPLGQHGMESGDEASFWPSFTDIMMVVVLIFLMATSLLIVRNWNLVAELQSSIEAEKQAEQMIQSTSLENATLEERLVNAEQLSSILRLRLLEKEEKLKKANMLDVNRQLSIEQLEQEKTKINQQVFTQTTQLQEAESRIQSLTTRSQDIASQLAELKQQLEQQIELTQIAEQELELAYAEIVVLGAQSEQKQLDIDLLEQDKINYNRELLTLQGDYDVVKSKYELLIKPARSAKGKYIAEVFYVKNDGKEIIRFKLPGDEGYTDISKKDVEQKLDQLKKEKGADLYVKIIIPQDSGLTYNEAWGFMSDLLDRYDYYYQKSDQTSDTQ